MVVHPVIGHEKIEDYLEKGYIHFRSILEVAGAPKAHVDETAKEYVEKIRKDARDVLIVSEEISEVTETKGLFSTLIELEMLAKDASAIAFFCFDYMPSSIEILAPDSLHYRGVDFGSFFNDMQARLHHIDRIVKELAAKNKNLQRNSNLLLRNLVIAIVCYHGAQDSAAIAKRAGIPANQLEPFLDEMVHEELLRFESGLFSLGAKTPSDKTQAGTMQAA